MRSFTLLVALSVSVFAAGEMIGQRAPGFSLPDRTFRYHDPLDYRGKILIVEFMQTTCPHCEGFSRILQEVSAKYAGRAAVLSIVNPPDTPENVGRYVTAHKLTFPILFDCGQVAASYIHLTPGKPAGFDIPRVFLVDAGGIIRRDFEYNVLTKDIFEGRGLFAELDKMLSGDRSPAKK